MFTKSVQIILSRAMDDVEFAKLLVSKPEVALANNHLSAEETAIFKGLAFEDFTTSLPARKRRTFSDLELNGQVRGRKQYM